MPRLLFLLLIVVSALATRADAQRVRVSDEGVLIDDSGRALSASTAESLDQLADRSATIGTRLIVGGERGGTFRARAACTPDDVLTFAIGGVSDGSAGCVEREWDGALDVRWGGASPTQTAAVNREAFRSVFAVATTLGTAEVVIPATETGASYAVDSLTISGTGTLTVRASGTLTSSLSNTRSQRGIYHFHGFSDLRIEGLRASYTGAYSISGSFGNLDLIRVTGVDRVVLSSVYATGANRAGISIGRVEQADVIGSSSVSNRLAGLLVSGVNGLNVVGGHYDSNGLEGDTGTGYGIALPVSLSGFESRRVIITGAQASNNARKGFDLHSGKELILSGFQAHNNGIGGVFALSTLSGSYSSRIRISDGIISGRGADHPIEAYGVRAGGVAGALGDDIDITNVSVYNLSDYGIWVTTGGIRRVRIDGCSVDGVTVRSGSAVSQGITISSDGDPELVQITNNTVKGARIAIQAVKGGTLQMIGNALPILSDDPHLDGVGTWSASTTYAVGDRVRGVSRKYGFYYEATTSGTTSSSEPVWITRGQGTVADGGVTWRTIGIAPYDGYQLGNAGNGLGFDLLQMSGNYVEEGYERNHRSADNVDAFSLRDNWRGTYDMDPAPITLTVPYQSVAGSSSVSLEMLTLPAQSYVRVVAAGGRQLSATRKLELHVGGSARHTVTDTLWEPVHAEGYYSGSIATVQLVLVNDGATVDMGGSVQVVVTKGVNL